MNHKRGGRWGLLPILVLVNAAAIWGQAGWAGDNLVPQAPAKAWPLALVIVVCAGFATAIELTGVFLANKADQAEDAGIAAGGIRLGSYAVGIFSGVLNFSHFWQVGPTAAMAFGFLSTISPFLWGIDSRVRRGRQVAPSRRFWHPVRSVELLRFAAWEGIADEDLALRAMTGQKPALLAPVLQYAEPIGPMPAPIVAEVREPEPEVLPIPISPAGPRAPRALRSAGWDARAAAELAVDGAKAAEIVSKVQGMSPATAGLFVKVAAMLRANPAAEIPAKVTGRSVNPEYVRMMRDMIAR